MTKYVRCGCVNSYQDTVYGKGNRVANKTTKKSGTGVKYRCTVCGALHD